MGKVKRYKNRITRFLTSDSGQRFFNFAYSIGAAIVIWGALFKILHLPGGNFLLSLGMGTEVLMFILSAFDRPPREYHWEDVYPQFDPDYHKGEGDKEGDEAESPENSENTDEASTASGGGVGVVGGGTIIIGGTPGAVVPNAQVASGSTQTVQGGGSTAVVGEMANASGQYLEQISGLTSEIERLRDVTASLNQVSQILLESYKAITENSENITRSSTGYVEQMQDLNHNIHGLNTIYEIQLKSVSSQLDSIDRVNRGIKDIRDMYEKSAQQSQRYVEETEKMARYMKQLNSVYEKMITAMTVNMYRPGMPMPGTPENNA